MERASQGRNEYWYSNIIMKYYGDICTIQIILDVV